MTSILPGYYYYPLLVFDVGFAALFGTMTVLNPMEGYAGQLPIGYDLIGDKLVGGHSSRVALSSLLGGVMWAITTALLLPLARNGMRDRPDLAEKVIRAHLISGAIIDPLHGLAYLYYLPRALLQSPKDWHPMIPVSLAWLTIVTGLKVGWCLGWGRARASDLMKKGR